MYRFTCLPIYRSTKAFIAYVFLIKKLPSLAIAPGPVAFIITSALHSALTRFF